MQLKTDKQLFYQFNLYLWDEDGTRAVVTVRITIEFVEGEHACARTIAVVAATPEPRVPRVDEARDITIPATSCTTKT